MRSIPVFEPLPAGALPDETEGRDWPWWVWAEPDEAIAVPVSPGLPEPERSEYLRLYNGD